MTAETTVSGVAAKRTVITDECREMHGDLGAFHKAAFALLKEYEAQTASRAGENTGVNYHLVLTVDHTSKVRDPIRPPPEPVQEKDSSERAKRPTERLTRMPEAEKAPPVTPPSNTLPPDDPKPDDSSGGAECGL